MNDASGLEDNRKLELVHDGMKVYDRDGQEIGKVDRTI